MPRAVLAIAVFVAACFVNGYRSSQAIDINSDESSYAIQSVALYQTGETRWAGRPFFVHPPIFFAIESVYFRLSHVGTSPLFETLVNSPLTVGTALVAADEPLSSDNVFNAIMVGRHLVVVYGAVLAVGLLLLGGAFGSTRIGLAAATISLVDPYFVRRNHFNMLDPLTTVFGFVMMAAYYAASNQKSIRRQRLLLFVTGFCLGLALLSKELAVLYVPPLIIFSLVFRRIRLRELAVPLVTSLLIYAIFPLWTWLNGHFSTWLSTRAWLLERLFGFRNDTGIGRPGTTVVRTISGSLVDYWPSLLLLASAGLLAALVLCLYLARRPRDAPAELLASFVLGIYGFFFVIWLLGGVINEQFFYLLMPVTILSVPYLLLTWGRVVTVGSPPVGQWSRARYLIARVLLVGVLGLCGYDWYSWVARYGVGIDDSYAEVEGQLADSLPAGARVIGRDVTDVFMLPKSVVYWGDASPEQFIPRRIVQEKIDFAVLNDQYLLEGYSGANKVYYDFVHRYGTPIRQFAGRRWSTDAYKIDYARVASDLQLGTASLAAGKPAVASATQGNEYPANAFDGDFGHSWASPPIDEAWIYVDLGQSVRFERVELAWEEEFAQRYELQVSADVDASNWTTFYRTDQGSGGFEIIHTGSQGRYVRLLMTRPATRSGFSLTQMEIRPLDAGPDAPGAADQAPPLPSP
jgi:4-amino-4-deoxy-L-arabinose transferase-like glycosyltransferase